MARFWDIPPRPLGDLGLRHAIASRFVGFLEVTARLKSADDLELLVKVLEANKPLFAKVDRLATEVLTLTQESAGTSPSAVLGPVWRRSAGLATACSGQMRAKCHEAG